MAGDFATAWTPSLRNAGEETLDLTYATPVRVDGVAIHETLGACAVARVLAWGPLDDWEVLWQGTAPLADGAFRFSPALRATSYRTTRLRIVLATARVEARGNIDAVGLVGDGLRQWATDAVASSSVADFVPGVRGIYAGLASQ